MKRKPERETWKDWIICPACKGDYYEIDVVCDDGTGPEYYCGYCDHGFVMLWKWWRYHVSVAWGNLLMASGLDEWAYKRWLKKEQKR
jgi:hypothetical protein